MLIVRLQRTGKRGQAYFRVVVLEHTTRTKGKYLELLGTYNPHQKELKVEKDRIEYWVSKGAQTSPTVNNLLVNYKIWDKPKMQSWKPKRSLKPVEEKKEEPGVAKETLEATVKEASKEETKSKEGTPELTSEAQSIPAV